MHRPPKRQLFSRFVAIVMAAWMFTSSQSFAAAEDELRAVRILEFTVLAQWKKNPTEDEGRKAAEQLVAVYSQLIARYPEHAEVRNSYAVYLWSIDRKEEAGSQWEIAAVLDPKNAETAYHLGGCRLADGRIKDADEWFGKAVALDPENPLYHYNLATALFLFRHQLGGADVADVITRALSEYRRTIQLAPFNVQYANDYAETFYALPSPDWEEARRAWLHVLEITSDAERTYLHLARVSVRLGHKKEAEEYLAKIQSANFVRVKASVRRQIEELNNGATTTPSPPSAQTH